MKKILFTLLLFGNFKAFSQINFSKIGIGVNGSLTTAYTGLIYGLSPVIRGFNPVRGLMTNKSKAFGGSIDYYFSPYITAGLEYNSVELKDGTDMYNRAFISNFTSIEIRGCVALGQFVDFSYKPLLYNLRNLYTSLGLGFISGKNNVADFGSELFPSRQNPDDFGKSSFSSVVSIPASMGYNVNFYNVYEDVKVVLGINYKLNFTFSDDIDGYNDDPSKFENKANDVYTTFGFSIKYLFGPKGLYYR